MARPVRKSNNFIETGLGVFNDLSKNLLEILRKDFTGGENILVNRPINEHNIADWIDGDPEYFVWEDQQNGVFAWVEAMDGGPTEVGQLVDYNSKHEVRERYFVAVQYLDLDRDRFEAQKRTRHIGAVLKDSVMTHPDLRGFWNGGLQFNNLEFTKEIVRRKDGPVLAMSATIRVTFKRSIKVTGRSDR